MLNWPPGAVLHDQRLAPLLVQLFADDADKDVADAARARRGDHADRLVRKILRWRQMTQQRSAVRKRGTIGAWLRSSLVLSSICRQQCRSRSEAATGSRQHDASRATRNEGRKRRHRHHARRRQDIALRVSSRRARPVPDAVRRLALPIRDGRGAGLSAVSVARDRPGRMVRPAGLQPTSTPTCAARASPRASSSSWG